MTAMTRKPKKDKAKSPEKSGSSLGRWEVLRTWGEQKSPNYIQALCTAIESEDSIPSSALAPLKEALVHLLKNGPIRPRVEAFARDLGLTKSLGRPKSEVNFWRASFYWYVRHGGVESREVEHIEAIAIVADEFENCDDSTVARAVRAHPEAEGMGKAMVLAAKKERMRDGN